LIIRFTSKIVCYCKKCEKRHECQIYEIGDRLNADCPKCGQLVAYQRMRGDPVYK